MTSNERNFTTSTLLVISLSIINFNTVLYYSHGLCSKVVMLIAFYLFKNACIYVMEIFIFNFHFTGIFIFHGIKDLNICFNCYFIRTNSGLSCFRSTGENLIFSMFSHYTLYYESRSLCIIT